MDFTDRGLRRPQQPNDDNSLESSPIQGPNPSKKPGRLHRIRHHRLLNITYVTLLFSITILLVGVVLSIFLFDGNTDKEHKYVDEDKYQAVFLNGGQVYFGKIVDLNNGYMSLAEIYYLTPNQAVQSDDKSAAQNNFTIKKLGCELHRPQDVMIINHDQIIFWENLKEDDSQNTVPGAIKKLSEQEQNCEQPAQTNPESSDSNGGTNDAGSTKPDSSAADGAN